MLELEHTGETENKEDNNGIVSDVTCFSSERMGEGQSVTPRTPLLQNKGDTRLDIHQERAVMASMLSGGDLFDLISVLHQIGVLKHSAS